METSAQFTQQDGLYINGQLHSFIEQQLCTKSDLACEEIYQTLATMVDEFGCQCRKTKHQDDDVLQADTLLKAYSSVRSHPHCHVDAQTTTAVLDEYCCQVPAIIVVALMDTLSGTLCDEPSAHKLYHRAAELTERPCVHREQTANASAA